MLNEHEPLCAETTNDARSGSIKRERETDDALIVHLRGPRHELLSASFTEQHASEIATTVEQSDRVRLTFRLVVPPPPAKLRDAVAGLRTIYAKYATAPVRPPAGQHQHEWQVQHRSKSIDDAVLERLVKLGRDRHRLSRSNREYVRSSVHLDLDEVLVLDDGEGITARLAAAGTIVFCPVHIDTRPEAFIQRPVGGGVILECPICRRTFGQRRQARYDFSEFDRRVRELASVPEHSSSVLLTRERYLPEVNLRPGISLIKSPKGSGKTEFLPAAVAKFKEEGKTVLAISHRRALVLQTSLRLDLVPYMEYEIADPPGDDPRTRLLEFEVEPSKPDDEGEGEVHCHSNNPSSHFVVCLDSLGILEPQRHRYDVLIVDESEQVIAHLLGSTLREKRRVVFQKLRHYVRQAEFVLFLDADLGKLSVIAAGEFREETSQVHLLVNEPLGDPAAHDGSGQVGTSTFVIRTSREEVIADLMQHVGEGKKCFLTTNSKRRATEVGKALVERFPQKRILTVTSDNSHEPAIQRLLRDVPREFRAGLEVLVASPAIGTGIDITFKDKFGRPIVGVDAVFGIFEGNINTHFELDQQLMRVRHPGWMSLWVDPRPFNYETDPSCITRELERSVRETYSLTGYRDDGTPIFGDDNGLISIWAEEQATSRASRNSLADHFYELKARNGWKALRQDANEEASAVGKAGLIRGRVLRQQDRHARLLAAESIDAERAQELTEREKAKGLSHDEQDRLERYRIERFYDEGLTSDLINFDEEGRTRQSIRRLQTLMSPSETLRDLDKHEEILPASDRQVFLLQRRLLGSLFAAANLYDTAENTWTLAARVSKADLSIFAGQTNLHRSQLDRVFNISLKRDLFENPIGQLKALLNLVGLALSPSDVEQSRGKKVRRYSLDALRYTAMMAIVEHRLQRAAKRAP